LLENKIKILSLSAIAVLAFTMITFYGWINFSADADMDGVPDSSDNCPSTSNPLQDDFDKDSFGDACDTDDDNDKIIDEIDAFDTDPTEWADFDFDGIGSTQDTDDDNDGILDVQDPLPVLATEKLTKSNLLKIEYCAIIENGTSKLQCNLQLFADLVRQEENNVNVLELAQSLTRLGTIDDCHFISHSIGHAVFEEVSNVFEGFIGFDGTSCRGGYFHGLLEAHFNNLKENGEPFPTSYETLCDGFVGTLIYRGCVHGLGHGFVNYFQDNLELAIEPCHQLSLFQDIFCTSGVMMQYTDNQMTRYGLDKENISNMCSKQELSSQDYWNCSANIGITLAFHTNHNFEAASKFCNMIEDKDGQEFCLEKLQWEIDKALVAKISPLTEEETIKFQPKWIKQGDKKWIVDFHSLAIISDFNYVENVKKMTFSFDKITPIKMYVWSDLLPEEPIVTIDKGDGTWDISYDEYENYTMIKISPKNLATITISGIE